MASLHNPLEIATPSQRLAAAARQARLHRFSTAASVPERMPGSVTMKAMAPIPNIEMAEAVKIAFPSWVSAIKRIQHAVCAEFDITLAELCSQRRNVRVVRPRQVGMYLCKTLTDRSYPEIGRRFGGRDHSTVISAVRRVEELSISDEKFRIRVEALAGSMGASLV